MSSLYPDSLQLINKRIFRPLGWVIEDFFLNPESVEYEACSFSVNSKHIQFRKARKTPLKSGQFVTIWKRNSDGKTAPYDLSDKIDGVIVCVQIGTEFSVFIFSALVLKEQMILSSNGRNGKRAIRVYPGPESAVNPQAMRTAAWQSESFVRLNESDIEMVSRLKGLFAKL